MHFKRIGAAWLVAGAVLLGLITGCGAERTDAVEPATAAAQSAQPAHATTPVSKQPETTSKIAGMPPVACSAEGMTGSCCATQTATAKPAVDADDPSPHGALHLNEGACGGPNPGPATVASGTVPATTCGPASADGLDVNAATAPAQTPTQSVAASPAKATVLTHLDGPQPTAGSCCSLPPPEAPAAAVAVKTTTTTTQAASAPAQAVQPQANPHVDDIAADACSSCGGR